MSGCQPLVAPAALTAASAYSAFVTGSMLAVDGGFSAYSGV
jgi:hypothetical protein